MLGKELLKQEYALSLATHKFVVTSYSSDSGSCSLRLDPNSVNVSDWDYPLHLMSGVITGANGITRLYFDGFTDHLWLVVLQGEYLGGMANGIYGDTVCQYIWTFPLVNNIQIGMEIPVYLSEVEPTFAYSPNPTYPT